MRLPRATLVVTLSLVALALPHSPARAQLMGHNFHGDFGLQSATQPPPGFWLAVFPAFTDNVLEAPILGLEQKPDTGFTDLYIQPINLD